jgi:hypothetical protein
MARSPIEGFYLSIPMAGAVICIMFIAVHLKRMILAFSVFLCFMG